ncbi:MAG: hypothetical protein IJ137_05705 [Eubacterium sp.]|nr:hypothetical protein [Eubacterium sp.]
MLFDKLRRFHEKTIKQYNADHQEEMEPWKKQVMDLHERSHFLFYYDDCELEAADGSRLTVFGEAARGELSPGGHLYLYDGECRLLGEGTLLTDPTLKEEKRRGFLRSRKNGFVLKITRLDGQEFSAMKKGARNKALDHFFRSASLLSDCKPDVIK